MKTPREILLARHKHMDDQLTRVTDGIVAGLRGSEVSETRRVRRLDWLWPSPLAWGALAAVWLAILALNGGTLDLFNPRIVARAERTPEMENALREQRRLLTEMVGIPTGDIVRPGPRSSIRSRLENA